MQSKFHWLNEPTVWSGDENALELSTEDKTDFWRETFYGFIRDNGHAFLCRVDGDFTASTIVFGSYEKLYDQAGLFLRINQANWIKAGIEYTDGMMHLSVVVTREISDWSVIPLPNVRASDPVRVRMTRHGNAVQVQFMIGNMSWQLARLCPFPEAAANVGVMACSPERSGFRARFSEIIVGPAIVGNLHAS